MSLCLGRRGKMNGNVSLVQSGAAEGKVLNGEDIGG